MADSLSGDISAAIEKATASPEPSGSPSPSAAPSSAPAAAPPSAPPARGSGSEPTPSAPRSAVAPTTRASEPSDPSGKPVEPPAERWPSILENARTKARQEAEAQFRELYGLSQGVDPVAVRAHLSALMADPVAYHRQLTDSLTRQGLMGQPQQPAQRPAPDLRSEDGRAAYSAEALEQLLAWQQAQLDQKLSQILAPLQQTHQTVQVERMRQQAWSSAEAEVSEAKTWDGFEELRPQIHELMAADKRVTLWSAYNRLHQAQLKDRDEKIRRETRQATLTELQSRPNPSTVTPAQPRLSGTPRSNGRGLNADLDDAIARAMAQHGAA